MAGQQTTGNDFPKILFRFPSMIRLDCPWENRGCLQQRKYFNSSTEFWPYINVFDRFPAEKYTHTVPSIIKRKSKIYSRQP